MYWASHAMFTHLAHEFHDLGLRPLGRFGLDLQPGPAKILLPADALMVHWWPGGEGILVGLQVGLVHW